jgi:hypothetical protein
VFTSHRGYREISWLTTTRNEVIYMQSINRVQLGLSTNPLLSWPAESNIFSSVYFFLSRKCRELKNLCSWGVLSSLPTAQPSTQSSTPPEVPDSLSLRPTDCPKMSVNNYPHTLRNMSEKPDFSYTAADAWNLVTDFSLPFNIQTRSQTQLAYPMAIG